MSGAPIVELDNVTKAFRTMTAVDDVSLTIKQGEFLSLLGPSGCGKTTTLRLIAGFETPTSGRVVIDGVDSSGISACDRPVNTVFQTYALFPHMTVAQNVGYGLRRKGWKRGATSRAVASGLKMVGLSNHDDRYPNQLSGGQQQRVALARCLVNEPKVLLLDEPLGALDLKLRRQMQLELMRIHGELGTTFIYVTHDQEEALAMSDRIIVMNNGSVQQTGTGRDLYDEPSNMFVADFVGASNLLKGTVVEVRGAKEVVVRIGAERIVAKAPTFTAEVGADVGVMVRPERFRIQMEQIEADNVTPGTVKERVFLGNMVMFVVESPLLGLLEVRTPYVGRDEGFEQGSPVYLGWDAEHAVVVK